jgi:hypothetical protein
VFPSSISRLAPRYSVSPPVDSVGRRWGLEDGSSIRIPHGSHHVDCVAIGTVKT